MLAWLRGNTLARNIALGVLATAVSAFVYSTQDDEPFQVDWAVYGALIWTAVRGGAVLVGSAIDSVRSGVGE